MEAILGQRLSELAIASEEAEKLVERRARRLQVFVRAGMPKEVIETCEMATRYTKEFHDACESIAKMASRVGEFPACSEAQLVAMAMLRLERMAGQNDVTDAFKRINREACTGILIALRQSVSEPPIVETLDELSADGDHAARRVQAALIVTEKEHLASSFEVLRVATLLGLIWRGLFYRGVAEGTGAALESKAWEREIAESLSEVPAMAASKLPLFGDFLALFGTLLKVVRAASSKERALESMAEETAEYAGETLLYLESYKAALTVWSTSAVPLQKLLFDLLTNASEIMSSIATPNDAEDASSPS
jgi:hypothetical protein